MIPRTPGELPTWGTTPFTVQGWGDATVPLCYGLDQGVELPSVPQTPSPLTMATPSPLSSPCPFTGGEGSLTQWVHCEFVVSFEAIRPVITQRVCSEFFSKVPTKVPTGYFLNETPEFILKNPLNYPAGTF